MDWTKGAMYDKFSSRLLRIGFDSWEISKMLDRAERAKMADFNDKEKYSICFSNDFRKINCTVYYRSPRGKNTRTYYEGIEVLEN